MPVPTQHLACTHSLGCVLSLLSSLPTLEIDPNSLSVLRSVQCFPWGEICALCVLGGCYSGSVIVLVRVEFILPGFALVLIAVIFINITLTDVSNKFLKRISSHLFKSLCLMLNVCCQVHRWR